MGQAERPVEQLVWREPERNTDWWKPPANKKEEEENRRQNMKRENEHSQKTKSLVPNIYRSHVAISL